jgi:hypothetical protein
MGDIVAWAKLALSGVGAWLLAVGAEIEPSQAVWVMATAGGLLGVALTEDRSIWRIVVHAVAGVVMAIAGAALIEATLHFPRAPVAALVGVVGARLAVVTLRQIETDGLAALWPKWFRGGRA